MPRCSASAAELALPTEDYSDMCVYPPLECSSKATGGGSTKAALRCNELNDAGDQSRLDIFNGDAENPGYWPFRRAITSLPIAWAVASGSVVLSGSYTVTASVVLSSTQTPSCLGPDAPFQRAVVPTPSTGSALLKPPTLKNRSQPVADTSCMNTSTSTRPRLDQTGP